MDVDNRPGAGGGPGGGSALVPLAARCLGNEEPGVCARDQSGGHNGGGSGEDVEHDPCEPAQNIHDPSFGRADWMTYPKYIVHYNSLIVKYA